LKKETKMNKIINFVFSPLLMINLAVLFLSGATASSDIKVYPRLITPGSAAQNESAFFDFSDFNEPKPELKIFDLTGRTVRSVQVLNPAAVASGWRFSWDGKDDGGKLVFPGVYVYQWREGSALTSGTIVVAR
jgi:hypothetical protein